MLSGDRGVLDRREVHGAFACQPPIISALLARRRSRPTLSVAVCILHAPLHVPLSVKTFLVAPADAHTRGVSCFAVGPRASCFFSWSISFERRARCNRGHEHQERAISLHRGFQLVDRLMVTTGASASASAARRAMPVVAQVAPTARRRPRSRRGVARAARAPRIGPRIGTGGGSSTGGRRERNQERASVTRPGEPRASSGGWKYGLPTTIARRRRWESDADLSRRLAHRSRSCATRAQTESPNHIFRGHARLASANRRPRLRARRAAPRPLVLVGDAMDLRRAPRPSRIFGMAVRISNSDVRSRREIQPPLSSCAQQRCCECHQFAGERRPRSAEARNDRSSAR